MRKIAPFELLANFPFWRVAPCGMFYRVRSERGIFVDSAATARKFADGEVRQTVCCTTCCMLGRAPVTVGDPFGRNTTAKGGKEECSGAEYEMCKREGGVRALGGTIHPNQRSWARRGFAGRSVIETSANESQPPFDMKMCLMLKFDDKPLGRLRGRRLAAAQRAR